MYTFYRKKKYCTDIKILTVLEAAIYFAPYNSDYLFKVFDMFGMYILKRSLILYSCFLFSFILEGNLFM